MRGWGWRVRGWVRREEEKEKENRGRRKWRKEEDRGGGGWVGWRCWGLLGGREVGGGGAIGVG